MHELNMLISSLAAGAWRLLQDPSVLLNVIHQLKTILVELTGLITIAAVCGSYALHVAKLLGWL